MNEDLKIIKKMYGEKMMHLCRELFPTLLEQQGLLRKLMLNNFAPSKFLYDDIIESNNLERFKNYIYSLIGIETKEVVEVTKTPKELLEDEGYVLYECKTEEDIQSFKKYYARGEELCTFNGGRLDRCHVFFAVKKNVDEIKRGNFKNPERQDEYGTSVISIQFTKGDINTLSIKNRYNHTVNNPDATFSNNLENIIEGLTDSFEKEYSLKIDQNKNKNFELPGYVRANNGVYYKYNYEIDNIYYCPNNIIIDHFEVKKYDPEKYIILDNFILDLQNKNITMYSKFYYDYFLLGLSDIEKINITKRDESGNKQIEIITGDEDKIIIEIDKTNQIIGYKNDKIRHLGDNFLKYNRALKNIDLPELINVGSDFLLNNRSLINLNLPNLVLVGANFIYSNERMLSANLPSLKKVGTNFLGNNISLISLNAPSLTEVNANFLEKNTELIKLSLPSITTIGNYFLFNNEKLTCLKIPKAIHIGHCFLYSNIGLTNIRFPNLEWIGVNCLISNTNIIKLKIESRKLNDLSRKLLNERNKQIKKRLGLHESKIIDVKKIKLNLIELKNKITNIIGKKNK